MSESMLEMCRKLLARDGMKLEGGPSDWVVTGGRAHAVYEFGSDPDKDYALFAVMVVRILATEVG